MRHVQPIARCSAALIAVGTLTLTGCSQPASDGPEADVSSTAGPGATETASPEATTERKPLLDFATVSERLKGFSPAGREERLDEFALPDAPAVDVCSETVADPDNSEVVEYMYGERLVDAMWIDAAVVDTVEAATDLEDVLLTALRACDVDVPAPANIKTYDKGEATVAGLEAAWATSVGDTDAGAFYDAMYGFRIDNIIITVVGSGTDPDAARAVAEEVSGDVVALLSE